MEKIKAVVFDIDGTIAPDVSWLLMTRDLGASVEDHKKIFNSFLDGKISHDDSREKLIKLWRDTGNATRLNLEKIFTNLPIFPEAKELIAFLQGKGVIVAFITGSMDVFAKITAEKLSVENYYANGELVFDGSNNLTDFHYPLDPSKKKLELFNNFSNKFSLSPEEVVVVGDSDNDIHIFVKTKKGIMIGKEPEILAEVAWKQVRSLSEVSSLIKSLV